MVTKPLDYKISKNYTYGDVIKSNTAEIHNIDNNFDSDDILENCVILAEKILEPIHKNFGKPNISSWYRSKSLNDAVRGSRNSDHMLGRAVDFEIIGKSNYDVAQWISINLLFDQLILEYYKPKISDSGWIHCSYNKKINRREIKRTSLEGKYLPGLGER